ncbi:urease accessory protein [Cryptococcus wingfieldii CBS 7118]|uniref:Urease accessory protein n=1 Tax=Cryptococcus wingfieldii CBS 7118 TaxID=1295528 RepID=A0A1E3JWN6_9TREE|nr:urease accessory protein [Cryptococcus wingfieldii CBS 7118]ODO05278.1 urease accessory protein [Cryptococcus wingfieldii CBS 7118]
MPHEPAPSPPRLVPGEGTIHLSPSPNHPRFASLQAAYPLKLLCPTPLPSQPSNLATLYTLAYGGGLVAGDVVSLRTKIDEGCGLVMLTQGSTKVFKRRPGLRPLSHAHISSSPASDPSLTRQRMHIALAPGSFVLLLPDSISPFRSSIYSQAQRFLLPPDGSASALILDWVNSGRGQRPDLGDEEIWSMDMYASTNEVVVGDKLVMRERMVLENSPATNSPELSPIAKQLSPYNIYATLLVIGPHFADLIKYIKSYGDRMRQFQLTTPPGLVWSFSEVDEKLGAGVVRVAARETEDVRRWLRAVMLGGGVKDLVGDGLWPRCI